MVVESDWSAKTDGRENESAETEGVEGRADLWWMHRPHHVVLFLGPLIARQGATPWKSFTTGREEAPVKIEFQSNKSNKSQDSTDEIQSHVSLLIF